VWLALIVVGQLTSPFLPWVYGNIAVLWLLLLLAPSGPRPWKAWALLVPACAALSVTVPLPVGPRESAFDLIYTLLAQALTLALALGVLLRPQPGSRQS
jgi:hypothetical protein